ncbi:MULTISPECIES: WXG100 family type VII secretion target [Streptomyces]|uniref:ESAT-6-like protein n=1 Tax=Streptomyces lonegramiae TaxID=3075524 RepID=A0ABU2XMP0_9ACTN|nr:MULTISPECIES: WXG100 family type VII secretion target [unclassified Streptomyces]KAK1182533.1 WXG100 family type VII secretion target [Streptomyces sp. NBS 14/10]MDT0547188.1 WXG100 family type VII secretion target [Streptomyces sp. DSM 41529]
MVQGDGILVDYESVESLAADLRLAAKNVKKEMDDIQAAVKRVTGGWEGEAHQAMLAAEAQFKARADHIQALITQVAGLVASGKDQYRATDVKASRLFSLDF